MFAILCLLFPRRDYPSPISDCAGLARE